MTVITYKRPALPVEQKLLNLEQVYDIEAYTNPDIIEVRLNHAKAKYEDVNTITCDEAAYVEFIRDTSVFDKFTKTGEHPLDQKIIEDIEADVDCKTVNIKLVLEMERVSEDTSFEYDVSIDGEGQIVFTPKSSGVSFVDVSRLAGYDSTEDIVTETKRRFTLTFDAALISEDGNDDWFYDIDEIGQVVITPDSEETSFISISLDDSLNLITEDLIDEQTKQNIITRFMQGNITILQGDPADNLETFVYLNELDSTHDGKTTKYYYDVESDTIVYV